MLCSFFKSMSCLQNINSFMIQNKFIYFWRKRHHTLINCFNIINLWVLSLINCSISTFLNNVALQSRLLLFKIQLYIKNTMKAAIIFLLSFDLILLSIFLLLHVSSQRMYTSNYYLYFLYAFHFLFSFFFLF